MYKIMIVEDEYHIRHIIREYFMPRNIEIIEATNGYEAIEYFNNSIDLVLLDIMMPGIDGYEVCKQLRLKTHKPIIFLSALSEEENQLVAFESGADDYVTKPFKPSILYAKTIAVIQRDKKIFDQQYVFENMRLDVVRRSLYIDGEEIKLAHKEYELLKYLCDNQNRILTREQILDHVWGYDYYGDGRSVDTYIKKVRKKLGRYGSYIQTIIKTGYMFKVVNENEEK